MNYIIIKGQNGNFRSIPYSNDADIKLREYNSSSLTISCVALGGNKDRYAVVNNKGGSGWSFATGSSFHTKMKEINKSAIKQIEFGYNDTYAIVKDNGYCSHCTCGKDYDNSGPWRAIERHQGNISYVAMTDTKAQWIVGYGSNGWESYGMSSSFLEDLRKAKSDGTIISVTLGKTNSRWVIESSDRWYYSGTDCFRTAMRATDNKRKVAIW